MKKKQFILSIAILITTIVELGFQTCWRNVFGEHLNSVLLLVGGVLTCWLAYQLIGFKQNTALTTANSSSSLVLNRIIVFIIFLLGTYLVGDYFVDIQAAHPVSSKGHGSDVIPSLQLYVKRFLNGEFPYQPLEFDGWTVQPTYFPMMWLPYCFSEILAIDYRWTAYLVFLIPIFIYQLKLTKTNLSLPELIIKAILPFLFLYLTMFYLNSAYGYGVEMMPIGLYLLLTLTLFHRSTLLIAATITFILLSRYAFTFWLPVYMLIFWIERGHKDLIKVASFVIIGILGLYIIPFLSKDWNLFVNGLKHYATTAEIPWTWTTDDDRPLILSNGFSTAIFFYDTIAGDTLERLKVAKYFHVGMCFLAAVLIFWNYLRMRKKGLNLKIYLLITLKFYLVIFYGFFTVPFIYLYQLPLLLSIPILYHIPFSKNNEVIN